MSPEETRSNIEARHQAARAHAELLSLNVRISRLRDVVAEGRATPEHVNIASGIADGLAALNDQFGRYTTTI